MRHIPKTDTRNLALLSFEEALSIQTEETDYDREKWLYVPPVYTEYRYILATRGAHPLITLGVNPSTARPGALDRTLQSVERIAFANGFDSFWMLNVYAERATLPDDLDREQNPVLHRENMNAFRYALVQCGEAPCVWAAWGAVLEKRDYLKDCLSDMLRIGKEYNARWVQAGTPSKKGHPHHPLYLKKDSPLTPFPVEEYLYCFPSKT